VSNLLSDIFAIQKEERENAYRDRDARWHQAIAEAVPECPKCHGQVTSFISDMEDSAVVSGEEQAECARHCDSEAWERYQERLHRWYNNPDEAAKEPRKPKYWSGPLKDAFAAGITTAFTRLSAATFRPREGRG
jgi:hypothetical protein